MSTGGLFRATRDDGRADWRVIFDRVADLAPGDQVTHEELLKELDTKDRNRLYRAVGRANRELWKTRHRSLGSVKGLGYRMLRAEEHEHQANNYQRQSRRRMSQAVAVIDATDLDLLDAGQREWISKVQGGMHLLARAMDDHARRISKHDDLISKLSRRVEELENRE